jgi:hypothetical protein
MHAPASLFVLSALLATLPAQNDAARPGDKPAAKAPFVFETGPVEVRTLVERCGAFLQRNILLDEAELTQAQGQGNGPRRAARPAAPAAAAGAPAAEPPQGPFVELQLPVVTDHDGCEDLLTSLLWTRGLALVPLDEKKGVYEVLAIAGARGREIAMRAPQRTAAQVLARPTLKQFVTVVHALQHTNAMNASNALRPFFASYGNQTVPLNLGHVGNTASFVLTGPQDVVASALQLLQAADVPAQPETQTGGDVRVDALMKQVEQLQKRLAALEEKGAKKQ